jgi:hypothetical protein
MRCALGLAAFSGMLGVTFVVLGEQALKAGRGILGKGAVILVRDREQASRGARSLKRLDRSGKMYSRHAARGAASTFPERSGRLG